MMMTVMVVVVYEILFSCFAVEMIAKYFYLCFGLCLIFACMMILYNVMYLFRRRQCDRHPRWWIGLREKLCMLYISFSNDKGIYNSSF